MTVLILSTSLCSYYSFPHDEILVLPALIAAFATGNRRAFLLCFIATNLGYAIYLSDTAGHLRLTYMFLAWTASHGWLLCFFFSLLKLIPREQATVLPKGAYEA